MTDKPNDPKHDKLAALVDEYYARRRAVLVDYETELEATLAELRAAFAKDVANGLADEVDVAAYRGEVDAINRRLTEVREMLAQID